jgi:UDP-N-acetylglucosamine 1-carboxyvinyltransferase
MREKFFIEGGIPLTGRVRISGSKNAALPIIAASILGAGKNILEDVPNIDDVDALLEIFRALGGKAESQDGKLTLSADEMTLPSGTLEHPHIRQMRASILLLAPLLIRFGEVRLPFPGGCVLGKRSAATHFAAFRAFGAEIMEEGDIIHISAPRGLHPAQVILPEISVTATENAVMLAAALEGETVIRLAASEPHVQNLCEFLVSKGAEIQGIGSHTLRIRGTKNLSGGTIRITPDYLEAGTFILAAILTNGQVRIENVVPEQLDAFFEKLREVGANFIVNDDERVVEVHPATRPFSPTKIQTGVFPAFPTDLHPQFAVLLTQCPGKSQIFETLFERKFAYLLELEKMGADVEILNPHQNLIHGGKKLRGSTVASQDIRAGAAMLLAALAANGETEISNIHYIHRGYDNIEKKLIELGAKIRREGDE